MNKKKLVLTLEINGKALVLGTGQAFGITKVEGLEASAITVTTIANAQFDGDTFTSSRIEKRTIVIEASHRLTKGIEEIRNNLISFFHPHYEVKLTVDYCGRKRYIMGRLVSFKDKRANLYHPLDILVELACPDPYFRDVDGFKTSMADKIPLLTTPFAVPAGYPFAFSVKVFKEVASIVNNGDVAAGLDILFKANGDVKNPRLDNLTTGDFLKVDVDMVKGDTLRITTGNGQKRIELNGVNISNKKDRLSTFFQLQTGENLLKYSADEGYTNLDVYPQFEALYLGV